jgi:hypothetical protein
MRSEEKEKMKEREGGRVREMRREWKEKGREGDKVLNGETVLKIFNKLI